MLMLVLCAGAGLRPSDISTIYPDDVLVDDLGIVFSIHGTNPRTVPLLRPWEEWIVAILPQAPRDIPVLG